MRHQFVKTISEMKKMKNRNPKIVKNSKNWNNNFDRKKNNIDGK